MSNNTLCNEIIEKYYASIYRYCFVRLDYNEYAADDCTQEVFLILLKKQHKLNLSDNIRAWLYETANRVIKAYLRKNKKDESLINCDEIEDKSATVISEISPVLDILSEEEYTLISDYYSTEYGSKSELAQKYGLTLTQLYKRVHTIKEKVKSNKNITKI